MKLVLVRHAESEANVGLKTSDPSSIPLTEKGYFQAIKLAERFKDKPDLIVTTPYLRTTQTASPLIQKFPEAKVEVWPLQEFTYLSPTKCVNTSPKERLPLVNQYWKVCDPDYVDGTGAESFNHFSQRVTSNFERLIRLEYSTIIVFTHSQVIKLLRQIITFGVQPSGTAMRYFRDQMLHTSIKNVEVFEMELKR